MKAPTKRPSKPHTLYHYTTQAGLLGMIQQKVLWVSSIRHLNDSAELSYAISILKRNLDAETFPQLYTRDLSDPLFAPTISFKSISKYLNVVEDSDTYVGSFSQERDQLSQWRAYSGGGAGFSIGFNFGMLKSFAEDQQFTLRQCSYMTKEHEELINGLVEKAKLSLGEKGRDGVDEAVTRCVGEFMRFAPRFKHPSFAEEKEWRLFRTVEIGEPVKFRVGKSMLIPYEEFVFRDEHDNTPIVEVVIGPTPHMALSKTSVERLLLAFDMGHVTVLESSVPFRDW